MVQEWVYASYLTLDKCFEKEYTVTIQKDTSNFSVTISLDSAKGVLSGLITNRSRKKIIDRVGDDSSVLSHNIPEINRKANKPYTEQLRELRLILAHVAKDFDLKRLTSLSFSMREITGLSEDMKEQYYKRYNKEISINSNGEISDLIKASHYVDDLNGLFSDYGVKIRNVFVDELVSYVPNSDNQETKSNSSAISKPVIDGLVILEME